MPAAVDIQQPVEQADEPLSQKPDVRSEMSRYWEEHSSSATVQTMMLDSEAEELSRMELPEMVSMMPSLEGLDVLELAAGIGRFTGILADSARSVHAVEFMETFLNQNRQTNQDRDNVTFQLGDVTQLQLEPESYDLVFSCWLLMYLSDTEVENLMTNLLTWVKPGGAVVIRESCFGQSGNASRTFNPTQYRTAQQYTSFFLGARAFEGDTQARFEIERSRCISEYVRRKGNPGQVVWRLRKVTEPRIDTFGSFQQFLDGQQYTINGVLRYERIFGEGFVSTGGPTTTAEYTAMLDLQEGQRVLDIGCGIGGGDFYMADTYGVQVVGCDLSSNMVNIALERAYQRGSRLVSFEIADATTTDFGEGTFDVVYSRDTILHIEDKLSLFRNFLRFLRPGGKLLITDYCGIEPENRSEAFAAYVAQRGYHLLTPEAYGQVLEEAGFTNVVARNATDTFVRMLETELERTEASRDEFVAEFSQEDYDAIVNGWRAKLERCASGDQMWGLFTATKPEEEAGN